MTGEFISNVECRNSKNIFGPLVICPFGWLTLSNFLWEILIKFCKRQEKLLFIDIEEEMKQEFETLETILEEGVEDGQSRQDHNLMQTQILSLSFPRTI